MNKTLVKGEEWTERFEIDEKDAPGIFMVDIFEKYFFWKRSKFEYSLICTKSSNEPKKRVKRRIKCKVYSNGQTKWLQLSNYVKYNVLIRRFEELYGDKKTVKYKDSDGEISVIDSQETLEIFFDTCCDGDETPKLFYLNQGETVKLELPSTVISSLSTDTFSISTPTSPPTTPQTYPSVNLSDVGGELEIQKGKWQLGGIIGKGGNATVYLGMNEVNGKLMAVKEINLKGTQCTENQMKDLKNEILLMKALKHENIVRYLGMEKKGDNLYIFVDYIPGGSLESILEEFSFTEQLIKTHTKQILKGLKYLHDNNIIHRDIKCGNILLDENGKVYLADFGCSKKITGDITKEKSLYGTPNYMAPEVINATNYTNKADIWSLGCTILEMIDRKPPWSDIIKNYPDPISFLFYMRKHLDNLDVKFPEKCTELLKEFLNMCFEKDEKKRATCDVLLAHEWMLTDLEKEARKVEKELGNITHTEEENFDDELADISTFSDTDNMDDLLDEEKEELKKLEKENFSDEKKKEKVEKVEKKVEKKVKRKKKPQKIKFSTIATTSLSKKKLSVKSFVHYARNRFSKSNKKNLQTINVKLTSKKN